MTPSADEQLDATLRWFAHLHKVTTMPSKSVLEKARQREQAVLKLRRDDHLTLKQIAERFGVSYDRVRQIIARGELREKRDAI